MGVASRAVRGLVEVLCVCRVFLWSADLLRQDGEKTLPQCSAALRDSWTHPLRPCSLSDTVVGCEYNKNP